jgi:hypothetical protein
MMKLLKAHGRFIVVLIVLLVILYVADSQFQDQRNRIQSSEAATRTLLTNNYRALFSDAVEFEGEPATIQGRRIQDRVQATLQEAEERTRALAFETAPDYLPEAAGAGATAGDLFEYYRRKELDLERELGFKRYFAIDSRADAAFGFARPDGSTTFNRQQISRLLRNLDIVRTVALSVEETGVQRLTGLAFRSIDDSLFSRGVPTRPATANEEPYLRGQGLEVRVQATEEALYRFLIDLQRPMKGDLRNRYLAIERFTMEKPDLLNPVNDLIDVTVLVVAYTVNEDSTYPLERVTEEETEQTTRLAPRPIR